MKFEHYKFVAIFFTIMPLCAHEIEMQRYENEVNGIQEIAGVTNYTLVLSCSQQNPIVSYAPQNFAESQDNSVHRYVLPNSTLSENIDNETSCVRQLGSHVEILLFGRLLAQTAHQSRAIFMVSSNLES